MKGRGVDQPPLVYPVLQDAATVFNQLPELVLKKGFNKWRALNYFGGKES